MTSAAYELNERKQHQDRRHIKRKEEIYEINEKKKEKERKKPIHVDVCMYVFIKNS